MDLCPDDRRRRRTCAGDAPMSPMLSIREVVRDYAVAIVRGLQGEVGDADFLRGSHVIATAKHFIADGGTFEGRDQGDARASEEQLRDIHGAGYAPAIGAGVQVVMASFSSWQGREDPWARRSAHASAQGAHGFRRVHRRRLERTRPGRGLHCNQLRCGDQRRPRHVHGAGQHGRSCTTTRSRRCAPAKFRCRGSTMPCVASCA